MRHRLLDPIEIRVLGALLEKEQTTPEYYPQTSNQVIAAANQRSNREPVTDLGEDAIAEALDRLRAEVLTWRTEGGRAPRWAHCLDRRWQLDPAGKAVMTLLMLRGTQTPGELRTRSDRLHAFASVAAVEESLARLASGPDPLVRELPRRPGQRENRWQHLVGEAAPEVEVVEPWNETAAAAPEGGEPVASRPRGLSAEAPRRTERDQVLDRLSALEAQVVALESELEALRRRLGDLS